MLEPPSRSERRKVARHHSKVMAKNGKWRVPEIAPRLREYPAHPMILNIGGPATWLLRAKGLVLRVYSI